MITSEMTTTTTQMPSNDPYTPGKIKLRWCGQSPNRMRAIRSTWKSRRLLVVRLQLRVLHGPPFPLGPSRMVFITAPTPAATAFTHRALNRKRVTDSSSIW